MSTETTEDPDLANGSSLKEATESAATSVTTSSQDGEDEAFVDVLAFPGELQILAEDFVEDRFSVQVLNGDTKAQSLPILTSLDVQAVYGSPLTPTEASQAVPPEPDGLVRYALVIPDKFCSNRKLIGGLNKRDYDTERGVIKPRRASLPVTHTQLLSSLTRVESPNEGHPRWIFNGVLNGWPSLRNFELISLEKKRTLGPLTPPDYMNRMRHTWAYFWDVEKEGRQDISPAIKDTSKIYRAKLRAASWSSRGWSKESPGFLFWYEAQRKVPRVLYGTNTIRDVGEDRCTMVHMISHRYAVKKESPRDKLTWHSVVLLEWEHGNFCTIVEGAYLNGIGGYKGRSNWYHDKDDGVTELYKTMPPEMISPWLTTAAEIRCYDVAAKSLEEMKEYMATYAGPDQRFLEPHYTFSHGARLTYRSRSHIAQYLINYISRDCSYSELTRNCQTLAADLCGFLAGKKDVVPYHPINRIDYHNRTHLFLYDSDMYATREKAHLKGKIAK